MKEKITLNEKPLSKKDTIKLAEEQGTFHAEYSSILTETDNNKVITRRHVYELPDNRFLYIRDVDGKYDGKGDIFPKEHFEKFVSKMKRMDDDVKHGRTSNISHWYFYSKEKENLIDRISILITELQSVLDVDIRELDFSTKSLDILSQKVKHLDINNVFTTLYDHLVAYIGEVIRSNQKQNTEWQLEPHFNFPVIATIIKGVSYNPINIVWGELAISDDPDFRKAYGKEIRTVGSQIKMAK